MKSINTKVVGVTFEGRQEIIADLTGSSKIKLERDANNPHDSNAVQVIAEGKQIGFLSKELAESIGPCMDQGIRYITHISDITGGQEGLSYGVNILIVKVEEPEEEPLTEALGTHLKQTNADIEYLLRDIKEETKDALLREIYNNEEKGLKTLKVLATEHAKIKTVPDEGPEEQQC